jgi:hypothetical protein
MVKIIVKIIHLVLSPYLFYLKKEESVVFAEKITLSLNVLKRVVICIVDILLEVMKKIQSLV